MTDNVALAGFAVCCCLQQLNGHSKIDLNYLLASLAYIQFND